MDTNGKFKVEFFVDETDSRIIKEAKSFRRTRPTEEIKPKWSKIRLGIKRVNLLIVSLIIKKDDNLTIFRF